MLADFRLVTVALLIACTGAACTVQKPNAETVESTSRYDSAAQELVLGCTSASTGTCTIVLDDKTTQRRLSVRVGDTSVIQNVSAQARTCVTADGTTGACAWTAVSQAS
jgi:hypothetical protein